MSRVESAAAEMIGAIALTAIIAAAIAIVGYQWVAQIPLSSPPSPNLIIACGNGAIQGDFYCRSGVIGCADQETISYSECTQNCSIANSNEFSNCIQRCEAALNCAPINDNLLCNTIFICHNGGDPLEISELSIFVNDIRMNPPFSIYKYTTESTSQKSGGPFSAGEVLRLPINNPPQSIAIIYHDIRSGKEFVLTKQKFR